MTTDKPRCGGNCLHCNPGAAHLGDTMTIQPKQWTPIDDHGTEIYLYGDQPADVAVQYGPGTPAVSFHDIDGITAVHVGAQRVVRLPSDDERAINALVDVLEALGLRPERAAS